MVTVRGRARIQQELFQRIHQTRFYLGERAPICQGRLRGEFGYLTNTPSAEKVLNGTYEFRDGIDGATKELLEECAALRRLIPADSVTGILSCSDWQRRWRRVKERTSSSISRLHFGHYIAGSLSQWLSSFHARNVSIAARHGFHLSRWEKGLTCMLEKKPGVREAERLRAILLMEADFNGYNKEVFVFGNRMLGNVRDHNLMPTEIFSERGRTASDGTIAKTLFLRYPSAKQDAGRFSL